MQGRWNVGPTLLVGYRTEMRGKGISSKKHKQGIILGGKTDSNILFGK